MDFTRCATQDAGTMFWKCNVKSNRNTANRDCARLAPVILHDQHRGSVTGVVEIELEVPGFCQKKDDACYVDLNQIPSWPKS
jgi:hypothetical protein